MANEHLTSVLEELASGHQHVKKTSFAPLSAELGDVGADVEEGVARAFDAATQEMATRDRWGGPIIQEPRGNQFVTIESMFPMPDFSSGSGGLPSLGAGAVSALGQAAIGAFAMAHGAFGQGFWSEREEQGTGDAKERPREDSAEAEAEQKEKKDSASSEGGLQLPSLNLPGVPSGVGFPPVPKFL